MKEDPYLSKLLAYIELANILRSKTLEINKYSSDSIPTWIELANMKRSGSIVIEEEDFYFNYQREVWNFLPQELKVRIWGETVKETTIPIIHKSVNDLVDATIILEDLAFANYKLKDFNSRNALAQGYIFAAIDQEVKTQSIMKSNLGLRINKSGILELKMSSFFELITQSKIDTKRIKLCLICHKIFWAKRYESWACSKPCGNALRQRRWQSLNKEEFNKKRRKNYAYKSKLAKSKEKKISGTL